MNNLPAHKMPTFLKTQHLQFFNTGLFKNLSLKDKQYDGISRVIFSNFEKVQSLRRHYVKLIWVALSHM